MIDIFEWVVPMESKLRLVVLALEVG